MDFGNFNEFTQHNFGKFTYFPLHQHYFAWKVGEFSKFVVGEMREIPKNPEKSGRRLKKSRKRRSKRPLAVRVVASDFDFEYGLNILRKSPSPTQIDFRLFSS